MSFEFIGLLVSDVSYCPRKAGKIVNNAGQKTDFISTLQIKDNLSFLVQSIHCIGCP
ncbi:hypothetical protein [Crenothrix sp.]|uniref:hypothetical protein n=1 Tax=Crenothrix sp. TaxID=3100433 RepID=UPI00374DAFBC